MHCLLPVLCALLFRVILGTQEDADVSTNFVDGMIADEIIPCSQRVFTVIWQPDTRCIYPAWVLKVQTLHLSEPMFSKRPLTLAKVLLRDFQATDEDGVFELSSGVCAMEPFLTLM